MHTFDRNNIHGTLHNIYHAEHTTKDALHRAHFTIYTIEGTLDNVHNTENITKCIQYRADPHIAHYTENTTQFTI